MEAFPSLAASLSKPLDDTNSGSVPTGPGLPNTHPVDSGCKIENDSIYGWTGAASGAAVVPIGHSSHSSRCESSSSTIDVDASSTNGDGHQEQVDGQPGHGSDGSEGDHDNGRPERDGVTAEQRQIDDATLALVLGSQSQFDSARFPDGSRKHLCPVCGKGFKRPVKVRRHLAVHLRSPTTPGRPRQTWRQVLEQETAFSLALGDFTPRACPTCGRYFTESKKYQMHILAHAGRSPYRCEICKKNFTRSDHLNVHLRTAAHKRAESMGEIENGQQDADTKEKDNSKETDDGSIRIVSVESTGVESPTFMSSQAVYPPELDQLISNSHSKKLPFRKACEHCSRVFINQRNYELHMQAHRGCSPHNCRICDRQFTRSDHLLVHYKTATHRRRLAELDAAGCGESDGFGKDSGVSCAVQMNDNANDTEHMTTAEMEAVQTKCVGENGNPSPEPGTSLHEGFVLETKQEFSPTDLSSPFIPFPPQLTSVEHADGHNGTPIQLHSAAYNSMSTHGAGSPIAIYADGENEDGLRQETGVVIISRSGPGATAQNQTRVSISDQEGRFSCRSVSLDAVQRYPVVPYGSEGAVHLPGDHVGLDGHYSCEAD